MVCELMTNFGLEVGIQTRSNVQVGTSNINRIIISEREPADRPKIYHIISAQIMWKVKPARISTFVRETIMIIKVKTPAEKAVNLKRITVKVKHRQIPLWKARAH